MSCALNAIYLYITIVFDLVSTPLYNIIIPITLHSISLKCYIVASMYPLMGYHWVSDSKRVMAIQ